LNLPAADKMVEPHFSMLWSETIPVHEALDAAGRSTRVAIVAGSIGELVGPPPPPNSWAARSESQVAIWTIQLAAGASWRLPAAGAGLNRALYYFQGDQLALAGERLPTGVVVRVASDAQLEIQNGDTPAELLMLQGKPIADPVAHYGPFVMNAPEEIEQAIADYRRTQYGGWPWPSDGPVHAPDRGRFAIHADGRLDEPI
jgi:redox-sensitive bicupin YhaK (pirin superfamily)